MLPMVGVPQRMGLLDDVAVLEVFRVKVKGRYWLSWLGSRWVNLHAWYRWH